MPRYLCILLMILFTSSCGTTAKKVFSEFKPPKTRTETELFQAGEQALSQGYYDLAIKQFELINNRYPYSKYSEQALLSLIYAYHQAKQNISSAAVAERFIRYYPRSEHVDYAFYMQGVANFDQDRGIMFYYLPIDMAERDIEPMKKSFEQFAYFLRRFPKSLYAGDARQRMIYIRNLLAQKELDTAKFYYKEKRWLACSNRLNYLVKHYSESSQLKPALEMLAKVSQHLSLDDARQSAEAVLEANFSKKG